MTPRLLPFAPTDAQEVVDALLYSVSHDLRSPLLSISLSAELLEDSVPATATPEGDGSARAALDAIHHGAKDLERMLAALTALSRAHRRPLEATRAPLGIVLGGHAVVSTEARVEALQIAVDPLLAREVLDAVYDDDEAEVHVRVEDGYVMLEFAAELDPAGTTPLRALAGSLQRGAGGTVERLAVTQILIERLGGALLAGEGSLTMWLPLADSDP